MDIPPLAHVRQIVKQPALTDLAGQVRRQWLESNVGKQLRPGARVAVAVGSRVGAALEIMRSYKISELPVVDGGNHPVGLLDVTDLIGVPSQAKGRVAKTEIHKPSVQRRARA